MHVYINVDGCQTISSIALPPSHHQHNNPHTAHEPHHDNNHNYHDPLHPSGDASASLLRSKSQASSQQQQYALPRPYDPFQTYFLGEVGCTFVLMILELESIIKQNRTHTPHPTIHATQNNRCWCPPPPSCSRRATRPRSTSPSPCASFPSAGR